MVGNFKALNTLIMFHRCYQQLGITVCGRALYCRNLTVINWIINSITHKKSVVLSYGCLFPNIETIHYILKLDTKLHTYKYPIVSQGLTRTKAQFVFFKSFMFQIFFNVCVFNKIFSFQCARVNSFINCHF